MLTGQLKPREGTVTILGRDIVKHVEEIQGDIGVCFETTNLYEKMSAIEKWGRAVIVIEGGFSFLIDGTSVGYSIAIYR